MRPMIGIVMDWQERGSFSKRPHYAIRDSYFAAVWQAGGCPVGIPLLADSRPEMVARFDGFVLPGGDYPSPSRWYGDAHGIADEHPRTLMNEALLRDLIALDKPFLAICAGHQELAAATGGLLYWRVAACVPGALDHRRDNPMATGHTVHAAPGSLLRRLAGQDAFEVNSHHFEAVKSVGDGVNICGTAPDGVVEAIEVPACRFALGVQWHPEFLLTATDKALFAGLIAAAKGPHKADHAT